MRQLFAVRVPPSRAAVSRSPKSTLCSPDAIGRRSTTCHRSNCQSFRKPTAGRDTAPRAATRRGKHSTPDPARTIRECSDGCFPTSNRSRSTTRPLQELADAMTDPDPASAAGNNAKVPAGFTYLGQFVDHDITLDLTAIGEKESDPTAVENFRTPALDLDSVYGLGPGRQPPPVRAQSRRRRRQESRSEAPRRQEHQRGGRRRDRRPSQRPAARSRGLRPRRRSSQRREPRRRADARRVPEVPQQGLRPAGGGGQARGCHLHGSAADRDVALPVAGPARLRRADHREGHRRADSRTRPPVLPFQANALHAGRVLGRGVSARAQHGARGVQPQSHLHGRRPRAGDACSCCSDSRGCRAASSAIWRPIRRRRRRRSPCCRATGSSTGAASTRSRRRIPAGVPLNLVAQDRSVRRPDPAHAAGRRREPAVPQPEARRDAGAAVGAGRRQGDEDSQSADAGRNRQRDRMAPWPGSTACTCGRRSGTTSSRRRSSAATASGSVRSARRSSPRYSSASCTATAARTCGAGQAAGSRSCRLRRRAISPWPTCCGSSATSARSTASPTV